MEGGLSGVASFQPIYNQLLAERPDLLDRLFQPFWFDRQHEHAPGDLNPANRWPVFRHNGDGISPRFSRRLILGGYEVAGEAIDDLGREAVEVAAAALVSYRQAELAHGSELASRGSPGVSAALARAGGMARPSPRPQPPRSSAQCSS